MIIPTLKNSGNFLRIFASLFVLKIRDFSQPKGRICEINCSSILMTAIYVILVFIAVDKKIYLLPTVCWQYFIFNDRNLNYFICTY